MEEAKHYLGDGVYASFDGYQIWLETSNGYAITNRIALEPKVVVALLSYIERTMGDVIAKDKTE